MPKIIHQRKKCLGCGACAAICPKFFEINERDGLAILKDSKKVGENFELEVSKVDCVKEAAEACPVQIIKINDRR
jgi:ferredoxin